MYPSHDELTRLAQKLAKELNYQGDIEAISLGVCYGYCGIAIEPLLTGNVREFHQQQCWLKKLIEEQHILEPGRIDEIPQENKLKLLELFKKILIHQTPEALIHIQEPAHLTYVQELAKTMYSVQSETLKEQGGLHKVTAFCGVYNLETDDLRNYLRVLKKSVAALREIKKDIPFALLLRNRGHYLLLGYHPTEPTGPWFFCNANPYHIENNLSGKPIDIHLIHNIPFNDIEHLAPFLNIGLLAQPDNAMKDYAIGTYFYCMGENHSAATQLATALLSNLADRKFTVAGSYEKADALGWTSLHMAAMTGDIEAVRLLNDVSIDSRDHFGATPFMIATQQGHTEVMTLFLQQGANINWLNLQRWTPLMSAVRYGHTKSVDLLIENSADLNCQNVSCDSALTIAIKNNFFEIAVRLIQSGAKIPYEMIDKDLVILFEQHGQRLLMPILNAFCSSQHAYYNSIDNFKEAFQKKFDDLRDKHTLTISERKYFITLYIVLRDDIERYERRYIAIDFNTFFQYKYIHVKRELTSLLKPQHTYHEKRHAAVNLLHAIENNADLPADPALYEGVLGEIAQKCFQHRENRAQSGASIYRTL